MSELGKLEYWGGGVSEIITYNPKRTATPLVPRLRSILQLRNP